MSKIKESISINFYKIAAVILILVLAVSLVPIFTISFYSYPTRDDYFLGYNVYMAHDTFFQTLKSGFERAGEAYDTWQGLFTVNFILAFVPSSFGTQYYALTAFIAIIPLIISTYYFAYQLLIRVLKTEKSKYIIITTLFLILSIQFLPSPVQGFYWYASVGTYTVAYSIMLVFFGKVISYLKSEKKSRNWINIILLFVLAALVSGCNYVVAIFSLLTILLLALYLFVIKNRKYVVFSAITLIILTGFVISMLAPGNMIRGTQFESMSPVWAIFISLPAAMRSVLQIFSNLPVLAGMIVSVLLIIKSIRTSNKKYKFKKPWLLFLISWIVYSATFTPTYYAMQGAGMGRVENIRMFILLWLVLGNLYYIVGYFYRSFEKYFDKKEINNIALKEAFSGFMQNHRLIFLIFITVFLVGSFYCSDFEKTTSYSAADSLLNREAKKYWEEQMDREKLYLSDEKNIVVDTLTVKPYVLYFWDIEESEDGRYQAMEIYYDKESIEIVK